MDLSSETETIFEPPSLYLTLQTWSVCSVKVWIHCRVPASHIFTVLSLELQESNCSQSQRLQSNQIWIDKETENSAKYRQTDRQTDGQTNGQIGRQADTYIGYTHHKFPSGLQCSLFLSTLHPKNVHVTRMTARCNKPIIRREAQCPHINYKSKKLIGNTDRGQRTNIRRQAHELTQRVLNLYVYFTCASLNAFKLFS
jgi:hypothetical protein